MYDCEEIEIVNCYCVALMLFRMQVSESIQNWFDITGWRHG